MKIKKDDTVIIITGKDKGKSTKVLKAFPREDKILVEGVNVHKRHRRPTREGQKGTIVDMPFPIHVSNAKKEGEAAKPKKAKAKKE